MNSRIVRQFFLSVAVTAWLFAASQSPLLAQHVSGAFHGIVTDTTGAVVPGAAVEVKNLASGQVRIAMTDGQGFFTITEAPPDCTSRESGSRRG
jgi:hypothetical protein